MTPPLRARMWFHARSVQIYQRGNKATKFLSWRSHDAATEWGWGGGLSTARLFLTLPLSLSPTSASGAHLSPPTCDLLDQTFTQHTSSPALNPPPSLRPPPRRLLFHPLAAGSRFVPAGRCCIMAESQSGHEPPSLSADSRLADYGK